MNGTEGAAPNRAYRDTMFRMLFREKENLLSLYNALNGTFYTDTGDLEIKTLENAVYMNYKNDVSFVMGFELMLYEHQSTVNPNMPLRHLICVTKVLQGIIRDEDIYSSVRVRIPAPRFAVFYNGVEHQPERREWRLSEAYGKRQEKPELELAVTAYNINVGENRELLEGCRILGEYAEYVRRVRENAKRMPLAEAVEAAVDGCIRDGVLRDFLLKNRAEAIEMSIYEYDEEKHLRSEREHAYNAGRTEGMQILTFLLKSLRGSSREAAIKQLREEYALSEEEAESCYAEAAGILETF